MHISEWENKVFNTSYYSFNKIALELFHFQYHNNVVYKQFTDSIGVKPSDVQLITQIPFLPIQFFKNKKIITTKFEAEIVFESSGTSYALKSKHYVKNIELYKKSFISTFKLFYGNQTEWCMLGLLPSYLERENSSLVFMVNELINNSGHPLSGFILNDYEKLRHTLLHNEILQQPTILFGVTYALLEFAEKYKIKLNNTTIIETGGMKGRRKEIIREQLHEILSSRLGVKVVHSEYSMTELLSQAYSRADGLFKCPPWMKVLIRDEDESMQVTCSTEIKEHKTGLINIIDMANIYSCSFIATDDVGKLYNNNCFEVLGRSDASDVRGCSLLTVNVN